MPKIQNLGRTSIDSLKLRIPISQLNSIDNSLKDVFVTINQSTGEVEKEFKKKSKQYNCDGYSFYVSLANVRVSKERFEDCIILLLNSKQLESRYFEGLTLSSIELVYNKVIELGILSCDFRTFINGAVTDVDFKKDYLMEMDNYKEIIKGCSLMSKDSNQVDVGKRLHKGESNLGISWSKRETSKYIANPFTKIYHKGLEFISPNDKGGSKNFKDKYLSHIDTSNIIRIETTVKNKRHLESLKLELKYFTLFDLLSIKEEKNDWVIKSAVNKHLGIRSKVMAFKKEKELSPKLNFELKALLVCTTESNWSLIRSIEYFSNGIENKDTKTRLKQRLTKLYDDYINETDYAPKVDKVNSFFDSIGWF